MGNGRRLREELGDAVKIVAAEPMQGEPVQGLRSLDDGFIPPIIDLSLLDRKIFVTNHDAIVWTRKLLDEEGIFAGVSSGAIASIAVRIANELDEGNVVFIVCDDGWKYLSSGHLHAARRRDREPGLHGLVVAPPRGAAARRAARWRAWSWRLRRAGGRRRPRRRAARRRRWPPAGRRRAPTSAPARAIAARLAPRARASARERLARRRCATRARAGRAAPDGAGRWRPRSAPSSAALRAHVARRRARSSAAGRATLAAELLADDAAHVTALREPPAALAALPCAFPAGADAVSRPRAARCSPPGSRAAALVGSPAPPPPRPTRAALLIALRRSRAGAALAYATPRSERSRPAARPVRGARAALATELEAAAGCGTPRPAATAAPRRGGRRRRSARRAAVRGASALALALETAADRGR